MPHGHLDGIEAAPGYAEHADTAVRPGPSREPGDHLLAIFLLLCRVLARRRGAAAVAETPDVDPYADVAMTGKVAVRRVVGRIIVLAIRQVLEKRRQALSRTQVRGQVQSRGKLHAIGHGNRGFDEAHTPVG